MAGSAAQLNFTNASLETGDIVTIELGFKFKQQTTTIANYSTLTFNTFRTSISITVDANYANIQAWIAAGTTFQAALGSTTMQNTTNLCQGLTFGDKFGCAMPNPFDNVQGVTTPWNKNGTFIGTAPNGSGTNNQFWNYCY